MKTVVLLACLSLPLPLFAEGGLPDKPYIYVEGKAEIEKPADVVKLRFDLIARNPDQANAREQAEKTLQTVGMRIDSIFAVSPVAFPRIQREIFGVNPPTAETESALGAGPEASQYRLAPVSITQSIHVIYLISPAK